VARANGSATVPFEGATVEVGPDDLLVTEVPRLGWIVETQRGATIALDTSLTPELLAEGIARDVVRMVQQARRDAGLDVSDHIHLTVAAPEEVFDAVRAHEAFLAKETLSDTVVLDRYLEEGFTGTVGADVPVTVSVHKS